MAQSDKHPTLGFGLGHLVVCGFEPHIGLCADRTEPAWDPLSLSLCPSSALKLALSLSQNKYTLYTDELFPHMVAWISAFSLENEFLIHEYCEIFVISLCVRACVCVCV